MIKAVLIKDLYSFPGNPFKVTENEEMEELTESIRNYGVITPFVVRPRKEGGYEIIAGHRRKAACEKAGIEKVPAFVREMDRDEAVIALVDSNLHREHILPSERAFAYKMKLEAIKHQGKQTSVQVEQKLSREVVADEAGESQSKVQRYIRLTNLLPELMQLVDEGRIAVSPAVELSYLSEDEQRDLLETIDTEEATPNLSQAQRMKKQSMETGICADDIFNILSEEKANQREQIKLPMSAVKRFFPESYTVRQMQDLIIRLLEDYQRRRERTRHEPER